MAFIRKKKSGQRTYHYLVRSVWVAGKPRQRVIAYLGDLGECRTLEEAYVRSDAAARRKLKRYLDPTFIAAEEERRQDHERLPKKKRCPMPGCPNPGKDNSPHCGAHQPYLPLAERED